MTDIKPHDLPVTVRLLKLEAAIEKLTNEIAEIRKTFVDKKPKDTRSTKGFKRFGADSWVDAKGNRVVPEWEKKEK
jgi:hypothetical protein